MIYATSLNYMDKYNAVFGYLEPVILESKVKCASGSIAMNKASKGDGIPAELFKMLKWLLLQG